MIAAILFLYLLLFRYSTILYSVIPLYARQHNFIPTLLQVEYNKNADELYITANKDKIFRYSVRYSVSHVRGICWGGGGGGLYYHSTMEGVTFNT